VRRTYAARTVIAAQRRVLDMVASFLEQLPEPVMLTLRPDRGTGLATGRDVLHHVLEAKKLRVRR
jgi:hypothetical protein